MGYLTKSLIENIHRKDLSMEEKGLGVYNYFKTKGIKGTPKELAQEVMRIRKKKSRGNKLVPKERTLLEVCGDLGLEPRTIEVWLEFLSVPQEIRVMELSRPTEDR